MTCFVICDTFILYEKTTCHRSHTRGIGTRRMDCSKTIEFDGYEYDLTYSDE
jgi:hypothetical protein